MKFEFNPSACGIRFSAYYAIYRDRLRFAWVTELMAGAGIAVGVALVFGMLVASSSILGSAQEVIRDVDGKASLELSARSSQGFSQGLAESVRSLPGVVHSSPILRESVVIAGPRGRVLGQVIGVTPGLVGFESVATKDLGAGVQLLSGGVGLPSGVASTVGATTEHPITLLANGTPHQLDVRAVLNAGAIGALSTSRISVVLLPSAQQLTDNPGRVTEVLVRPGAGQVGRVEAELRQLDGGLLNVEPADHELQLAATAVKPTSESTSLFAAISMMVGFLLALNAVLLTVPERRVEVADMREQGYVSRQVVMILLSQAVVLGVVASVVGVVVGDLLARTFFNEVPNYLATTFPITGYQKVTIGVVLFAVGCGILAAIVASMAPLLDLRPGREIDAVRHEPGEPGQNIGRRLVRYATLGGCAILAVVVGVVLLDPVLTIAGGVALALAALCFMPVLFVGATRCIEYVARNHHGGMVAVAAIELDATVTRSVALACITALAIYGSIAVGGARTDLIHGLDQGISQQWSTAAVWVTPDQNIHDTDSFNDPAAVAAIPHTPSVASVSVHQGAFLDVGAQRLWIRVAPPGNGSMILPSQLIRGNLRQAERHMASSGWATVSSGFASEHDLGLGQLFTLPTPAGLAYFRVAAITTNIGWPPGTITLNTAEYEHDWLTDDPTTIAVNFKPGIPPSQGAATVTRAIGSASGLHVQTASARITEVQRVARQGLSVLTGISTLLLLISALALAAALSMTIYQRRRRLASLKAQGFDRRQLWRGVLIESAVVLGIGCLDGALLGLAGHALADRYLRVSTSFPAPFSIGVAQVILTLLVVIGVALAVIAVPGYATAGVAPELNFQE